VGGGLDAKHGEDVGTRLGWLTALAALALALARLTRLVDSGAPTEAWPLIVLAAAVLGGTMAMLAASARLPLAALIVTHVLGSMLVMFRVTSPDTLLWGLVPSGETINQLWEEVGIAVEVIRYGAAPVVPVPGLVAVLAFAFWQIGALTVVGARSGRMIIACGPALVFYLQLATFDRRPPGGLWATLFILITAMALIVAGRRRKRVGWARNASGRPIPGRGALVPASFLMVMLVSGLYATTALAARVPEAGYLSWRNVTGFGGGLFGGVSINLFTSLQQDILNQSDEPVFIARVSSAAPPNKDLYWKLITLDTFDGEFWLPTDFDIRRPQASNAWEAPEFSFRGETVRVAQVVQIRGLRQNYLPILYSPVELQSETDLLADSYLVREDGSVKFDARTFEGLIYNVVSDLPVPDYAAMASTRGQLSPIFAAAVAEGAIDLQPAQGSNPIAPSRVREQYLSLPEDLPADIRQLARAVTENASTAFERAFLLETFFRDSGLFTYDAEISSGHSALDLAEWLNEPESRNYRSGYCQQFATAMAVMARTIGIPSRVVIGFTPGDLARQADGTDLIVVRQRNAHAWVELWMPGQGWVRFDPTPRADGINPATTAPLGFDPRQYLPPPSEPGQIDPNLSREPPNFGEFFDEFADPTVGLPTGPQFRLPSWSWALLGVLAVMGLVPAIKALRRWQRWRRIRGGDITAAWLEITDRLRDLGRPVAPDQTPLEVAHSVNRALVPLATKYSTAVYGEQEVSGADEVMRRAENHLRVEYTGVDSLAAWMRPGSLIRRD
jgi:hypothetical protein